jgi:hypothetical protein
MGIVIFIGIGIVALAVLGSALYFATDSNRRVKRFARSTDLIPGQPGRAPAEWAKSGAPEAVLHQRIRYAIADVHKAGIAVAVPVPPESAAAAPPTDLGDLDAAVFALDDRLIAAAQLPAERKSEELAAIEPKVASLEELTSRLWAAPAARRAELLGGVTSALRR